MALHTSPVSRNLQTSIRMLGLDIEDLLVLGVLSIGVLIVGGFVFPRSFTIFGLPANWALFLLIAVGGFVGLTAFKYGKPRGYLMDVISWYTRPRSYGPHERDTVLTRPYIEEYGDDKPGAAKGGQKRA